MRVSYALVIIFAFSTFGQAQATAFRRFDIGWSVLSYSRQGDNNLYGGDLSFTVNASRRIGVVADLALHETASNPTLETAAYRFGPRFYGPSRGRISTFAEVLAGGVRVTRETTFVFGGGQTVTSVFSNGLAFAGGGGMDVRIRPWLGWRAVQADYSVLRFEGATSNGVRVGTGLVFRFGS